MNNLSNILLPNDGDFDIKKRLREIDERLSLLTANRSDLRNQIRAIDNQVTLLNSEKILSKFLSKRKEELKHDISKIKDEQFRLIEERNNLNDYPRLKAFLIAVKRRMSVEDWKATWKEVEECYEELIEDYKEFKKTGVLRRSPNNE